MLSNTHFSISVLGRFRQSVNWQKPTPIGIFILVVWSADYYRYQLSVR